MMKHPSKISPARQQAENTKKHDSGKVHATLMPAWHAVQKAWRWQHGILQCMLQREASAINATSRIVPQQKYRLLPISIMLHVKNLSPIQQV
jgi:hypothetical protein